MHTESLERALRDALRETLDAELGPDPRWTSSPAGRRVAELERRRRWPMRALAVAAVITAAGGLALLAGALNQPRSVANGWVAFTVAEQDPAREGGEDVDIWFTGLDQQPRRVVGSDADSVDQVCPAFSPDGRSLAYGSIEGRGSTGTTAGYRNSALVIADVADDGTVAERLTIDVGDGLPPPCAVWSPDSEQVVFAVPLTSPINPSRSGEGSEVRIVRLADGHIAAIPDLLATDLEWSPDGSMLAIAGGVDVSSGGLRDGQIHLYELSAGTLRTFGETLGATSLTWSPDGGRIAYAGRGADLASEAAYDSLGGLRVLDVDSGQQEVLVGAYHGFHGAGPVWSPDGETIVYQRSAGTGGERHEAVLVRAGDRSEQTGPAEEVVMPHEVTTADGSSLELWPWRVTWSPDGTYLLYVAWTNPTEDSERTLVVAVPTDTDAPAVVLAEVNGIGAYDFADDAPRVPIQVWQRQPVVAVNPSPTASPDPSPNGTPSAGLKALAYGVDGDVFLADADGSHPVMIADSEPEGSTGCAPGEVRTRYVVNGTAWSPDGRYLAYWDWRPCALPPNGWGTVFISDAKGNAIASFPGEGWAISWSPDSTRVAVLETWMLEDGQDGTILVYGLNGTRLAALTVPSSLWPGGDFSPAWSRDGSSILLPGVRVTLDGGDITPSDESGFYTGCCAYSPDGSLHGAVEEGTLVLEAANEPDSQKVGPTEYWSLAWSPDGKLVAFERATETELLVRDVATGADSSLFDVPESDSLNVVEFTPDGERILFTWRKGDRTSLWSIAADGSDSRRLIDRIEWADLRPLGRL